MILFSFHDKEIDITIKEAEEGIILRAFIANYNDTHVKDITDKSYHVFLNCRPFYRHFNCDYEDPLFLCVFFIVDNDIIGSALVKFLPNCESCIHMSFLLTQYCRGSFLATILSPK